MLKAIYYKPSFERLKMYIDQKKLDHSLTPTKVAGKRGVTTNGTGYIFYNISPLATEFINNEAQPHNSLFEIGSGFSDIAGLCLAKGVGEYVACDLSQEHLAMLVNNIKQKYPDQATKLLQNLFLLEAKAPDLPDYKSKFDAIMIHAVFHFLHPNDVSKLFQWVKKALKPNGRFYLLTATQYTPVFGENYSTIYENNYKKGVEFPGFVEDTSKYYDHEHIAKNQPCFKLPKQMLLTSPAELGQIFINNGFDIVKTFATKWPTAEDANWTTITPKEKCSAASIIGKLI